jgi:hypothetical protein
MEKELGEYHKKKKREYVKAGKSSAWLASWEKAFFGLGSVRRKDGGSTETIDITRCEDMRNLGKKQIGVLAALQDHGSWNSGGKAWNYDTPSQTLVVMKSLERRGLVNRRDRRDGTSTFSLSSAGKRALAS